MNYKQITFNSEARKYLKQGINILADAVKVTLGPKGKTVLIESNNEPYITKDGVTVAKSINLKNPLENLGAQLVKSVSAKTGTDAGDGTTTATVLAQAIINTGIKNIEAGCNPLDIKNGIDKAVTTISNFIKDIAIPIDYDKIEKVATISANNNSEIGKLIANAMRKVSINGVITLEESKNTETFTEIIEGTQFECGFVSPYFITDSNYKLITLTNAQIYLYNGKLESIVDVIPLIESSINSGKQYLIVVNDIEQDVLNTLVANKVNTNAKFCVVKAPYFGERRKAFLQDLAVSTGGLVVNPDCNLDTKNISKVLGFAKRITITNSTTTIINGNCSEDYKQRYINALKEQKEVTKNLQEKEDLQERIDNLKGGVAVIYVGANSNIEMLEKKDRIDDALCATRSAISEGIIPGGGSTYIKALNLLDELTGSNFDEQTGINIIKNAIVAPFKQICINAGISPDLILNELQNNKSKDIGYNAKTNKIENLLNSGVIDPAKVARVALENAASVASTFLTTECVITNVYE